MGYLAKLGLYKNDFSKGSNYLLTPKLLVRYAPGHMRDLDSDNLKLSYSNLFTLNKNSQLDVVESGTSAAVGIEFSNLNFDNFPCSFKWISRYISFPSIFEIFTEISEKSPCFHNFLIEFDILSPGTEILSPILSPLILIRVFLSRYFVPFIVTPDNRYS